MAEVRDHCPTPKRSRTEPLSATPGTGCLGPAELGRAKDPSDDDDDPAYFTLFAREDVIHSILSNGVSPPSPGAVPPPVAGTGGNAPATSFLHLWQFMDKIAMRVGMTQHCLVNDFYGRREPGVYQGMKQHTGALFENELDKYTWILGGQQAGRLYAMLPTGTASTSVVQKRVGPFK